MPHALFVEVEKDARYWLLTYALDDVDLRIRISHVGPEDPGECVGEVRLKGDSKFMHVGMFWIAPIAHTAAWPDPPNVDELPNCWRAEFLMLIRLWSELTAVTLFAASSGQAVAGGMR